MNEIIITVSILGVISFLTWGAAETLKEHLGVKKVYIALVLGPVGGLLSNLSGVLPIPTTNPIYSPIYAAFLGLICSLNAKFFADIIGDRIITFIKGPKNGV